MTAYDDGVMRLKTHAPGHVYRPGESIRLKLTFARPIASFGSVRILLGGPMHGEKRSEIELTFQAPANAGTSSYIVGGTVPADIERGRYHPIAVYVRQIGEFEQTVAHPSGDGSFFVDIGDAAGAPIPDLVGIESI